MSLRAAARVSGRAASRIRAVVLLAALASLAGCGGDGGEGGGDGAAANSRAALWFTAGEQFHPVEVGSLEASGPEPALEALLAGPAEDEADGAVPLQTQIPEDSSLRELDVSAEGQAVVKLSPEFIAGIPARPAERNRAQEAELDARVAQVTYTVTQFEQVDSARVSSGGVLVRRNVDREDYAAPPQGPKPVIRPRGQKLPATRQVQTKLAKLRYLPREAVDGIAGYRTGQAVIAFQAWHGLLRDGVVGQETSAALRRARPPKPRKGGPPRRIEVHRARGVALLVDRGRTVRAIHVSTGAPGTATPSGRYSVFRKELRSWSVPFQTWLPYASYFNQGIAFHAYPDVPPHPASHGCVRVPAPEAEGVYEFAAIGTPVVVV